MDPIPTARKAYGLVRRESVNEKLLNPEPKEPGIGVGLAVFDRNRTAQNHPPPRNPSYRKEEDKSKLVCTHCGGKKHTKDTCFHIHGFPEWCEEMKKARQARNTGRNNVGGRASAAVAIDRATYTDKSAGNNGGSDESQIEKPTVASVSVAKSWSEGTLSITGNAVDGERRTEEEAAAARVPIGSGDEVEEITALSRFGNENHLYTPNYPKSQSQPQLSPNPKTDPETHYSLKIHPQVPINSQMTPAPYLTPKYNPRILNYSSPPCPAKTPSTP